MSVIILASTVLGNGPGRLVNSGPPVSNPRPESISLNAAPTTLGPVIAGGRLGVLGVTVGSEPTPKSESKPPRRSTTLLISKELGCGIVGIIAGVLPPNPKAESRPFKGFGATL